MDNESYIIFTVALGSLMMFLLVLVIITIVVQYSRKMEKKNNAMKMAEKDQELKLLKAVIETQESEREQIASNLHDEVGPLLASHKLNLNLLKYDLADGLLTKDHITTQQDFIDDIITNIRSISYDLTPHFLLKFGLNKAIFNYLHAISEPEINMTLELESYSFSKTIEINTYRIILELLNNIFKHDQPTLLSFSAKVDSGNIIIHATHNGSGLTNSEFLELAKKSTGLGLNSIQTRLTILDAKLEFNQSNKNSNFRLQIPIKSDEE